jgi:hypothetical protein
MGHTSFWFILSVNLLRDNIDNINKNTDTLIDASKEVGLDVNTERVKHMLLSHHQNVGQIHETKVESRIFEHATQFKCLGTTTTNQILIPEEIIMKLNYGNACYHSVQNHLSCLLCKKF